jgi:hypothetical protein
MLCAACFTLCKRRNERSALTTLAAVACAQEITRSLVHPFCLRQYASFQDRFCLYFLFDLMPGGDLMDVLEAEVKVIHQPVRLLGLLQQQLEHVVTPGPHVITVVMPRGNLRDVLGQVKVATSQ